MKSIALFASLMAAGAAVASSVSSTATFGVLKVSSDKAQTIISVPWVAAGSGNDVMVKDFVKTTGMTDGDQLYLYNTTGVNAGKFTGWVLDNDAWVAAKVVSDENPSTVDTPADFASTQVVRDENATIAQGSALIIVRQNTNADIYLYGQYRNASSVSYTINRAAGRTTLFAPVNTSGAALALNDSHIAWNNAVVGDQIKLQGTVIPLVYTYTAMDNGNKWARKLSNGEYDTNGAIRAGQGAWYITNVAGSDVTVTYTP